MVEETGDERRNSVVLRIANHLFGEFDVVARRDPLRAVLHHGIWPAGVGQLLKVRIDRGDRLASVRHQLTVAMGGRHLRDRRQQT